MYLQLFGGRGGSSGGGGGLSLEKKALKALEDGGITSFEELSDEYQQAIVDYMSRFLVENEGKSADSGVDYIWRDSMKGMDSILSDIASNGALIDSEGQTLWVSYTNDGSKNKLYHPLDYGDDNTATRKALEKVYKDYKAGKIKGIYYSDSGGDIIAGRGFVPLTSKQSNSSYLTFGPGKLDYKTKKSNG